MGNQASAPVPGTTLQVFGAGWSRTGTASLSAALEILLDGPVYHCGTQVTLGPPHEIRSWIKLLDHWPPQDAADEKLGAPCPFPSDQKKRGGMGRKAPTPMHTYPHTRA